MMRLLLQIFFVTAGLFAAGCANVRHGPTFDPRQPPNGGFHDLGGTNVLNPVLLQPPTNEFRLGPGDNVEIELLGSGQG